MDLNEILIFTKVVEAGSFTAAARQLDMPKSTVSRKVADLEERLGARLLQRTTRKLHLTDVGNAFYQHAARVAAEMEEAERVVTRMQEAPRGLLRITVPINFDYLGPVVASFLRRYPDVQVDMVCADRVIDLVEEGFDVAIRAGVLSDSTLIARPLGALRSFVVASPAFLKAHTVPKAPEDLARLDCVVLGAGTARTTWHLQADGKKVSVVVRPRLVVNDFDVLRTATLAGVGVGMLPVFRCIDDLRVHRLTRLLPAWCSPTTPLQAVYPSTRHLSPKVKAFLDHLTEQMTPPPWEVGPPP